jgi:hypothetical protein
MILRAQLRTSKDLPERLSVEEKKAVDVEVEVPIDDALQYALKEVLPPPSNRNV